LPIPEQHTLLHHDIHYDLERWTLFQALPKLMTFDKELTHILAQIRAGHMKVPNALEETNTPTLWTYYNTLPKWARDDPIVRNVMMACEYHQPTLTIRQKEDSLNMACSFLRPIEPTLKKVLEDAILSQKVKLNMQTGQQMLQELPVYDLDDEGEDGDSEDYGSGGEDEADRFVRMTQG